MEKVPLKPDHLLMDPDFEGYKLSLEPVPVRKTKIQGTLEPRSPSDDQFSFLHAKLFSGTNLLVADRFDRTSSNVYLLNTSTEIIHKVNHFAGEAHAPELIPVWSGPEAERVIVPGDYNPSLSFANEDFAIFADGRGVLFVLKTGNRFDESEEWTTTFHDEICGSNRPFVVASAAVSSDDNGMKMIHCLLIYVEEISKVENSPTSDKGSQFANVVEWISLVESAETCISTWKLARVRRYLFNGSIDFLDLGNNCSSILCSTDKPFKIVFDSEGLPLPAVEEKDAEKDANQQKREDRGPSFFWMQGVEDIAVWVMLPEGSSKKDVKVILKPSEIVVEVGNEEKISGKLWNILDGDSMTWTIQRGFKLEITACKAHEGLVWKRFLKDETVEDGEEVMDPNMVEKIHQQFVHFNTQQATVEGQSPMTIYNSQELEDCDESLETEFTFYVIDENRCYSVDLSGRQWLFNLFCESDGDIGGQCICLRNDVDGLVWQPNFKNGFSLKHIGSFCALGYVQASKQQRKFCLAPPDLSYSVIFDRNRHIYIYHEPKALASECQLRNRKSGKDVKRVAKQNVVTLEDNDEIVGAHASNKNVVVATKSSIFVIRVNV